VLFSITISRNEQTSPSYSRSFSHGSTDMVGRFVHHFAGPRSYQRPVPDDSEKIAYCHPTTRCVRSGCETKCPLRGLVTEISITKGFTLNNFIFFSAFVLATTFASQATAQCANGTCAVPQAINNTVTRSAVVVYRTATAPVRYMQAAPCRPAAYQPAYRPASRVFWFPRRTYYRSFGSCR